MKILHTSDLHLGISLLNTPLLRYQRELKKYLSEAAENVDAAVIAGDIFDTSVASAEAVRCWSELVSELCIEKKLPVIVCAGNHDGAARLASCGELLKVSGLYVSGRFEDAFSPVVIGNTAFYAVPYFNPAGAAEMLGCEPSAAAVMEAAAKKILSEADGSLCNVIVAHCFAAGGKAAESDVSARASESIGGADRIPLSVFDGFDYAALGHLHKAQTLISPAGTVVRYSGTPMPYSFSEAEQDKTFTIFDTETHTVSETAVPSGYRLRTLEDTYENILKYAENDKDRNDLMKITVTDRYYGDGIYMKLKELYPNLLRYLGKSLSVGGSAAAALRETSETDIISLVKRYSEENRGSEIDEDEIGWLAEALEETERTD